MRISDWSSDVCSSDLSDALDDYLEGFQGKDLTNTRRRIEALIRPNLGHYEVSKLEPKTITDWMNKIASSPARLRTAKGAEQNFREPADTDEARRRRKIGRASCRERVCQYG